MIVDDHAGVRKLIRQLAACPDDTVRECATGDEAVRVATEFRPDLVTMDVRMPGICGIEAARAIAAAQPSARVVMVTTHDQPDLRQAAREAGAFAYLPKDSLADIRFLVHSNEAAPSNQAEPKDQTADTPTAPVGADAPASPPASAIADENGAGLLANGSRRVLLVLAVEDSEADCDLIRNELVQCGYAPVIHRVSTEEAMRRALVQARWDIILTDYHLPGFGATAALSLVRELAQEIPVVCITGSVDEHAMTQLLKNGARACVNKDALGDLCGAVEQALSQSALGAAGPADNASNEPAGSVSPTTPRMAGGLSQSYAAQLERRVRELGAFAGTVAHELNAPLRVVRWLTAKLTEEHDAQLPDAARSSLRRIDDGCRTMSTIIERLLSLARLDRTGMKVETVSTNSLVAEAWSEVCPESERRRIDFKTEFLPDVRGDRTLLRLVFVNLLANALKYSARRERPIIEVNCSIVGGTAVFLVKDNGTGFDMRHAGQLFQPFRRMHSSAEFEGTGLGLAIVHRILDQHDGRIWAEAAVAHGATFYFTLPYRPSGVESEGSR